MLKYCQNIDIFQNLMMNIIQPRPEHAEFMFCFVLIQKIELDGISVKCSEMILVERHCQACLFQFLVSLAWHIFIIKNYTT